MKTVYLSNKDVGNWNLDLMRLQIQFEHPEWYQPEQMFMPDYEIATLEQGSGGYWYANGRSDGCYRFLPLGPVKLI
jgi:hypothetical protein